MAIGKVRRDATRPHDWEPVRYSGTPYRAARCRTCRVSPRDFFPAYESGRSGPWIKGEDGTPVSFGQTRHSDTPYTPFEDVAAGVVRNACTTTDVSFEGAVLATRERNGYHDSDFYAIVWDDENGRITTVEYATTRFPTERNYATVDATDEVKAKARAWLADHAYGRYVEAVEKSKAVAEARAKVPRKGDTVRFVAPLKSRKQRPVAVGETGRVIWTGESSWNGSYPKDRIGVVFEDTDEPVWMDLHVRSGQRVEVVGWENRVADERRSYLAQAGFNGVPTDAELRNRASRWAASAGWHSWMPVPAGFVRM